MMISFLAIHSQESGKAMAFDVNRIKAVEENKDSEGGSFLFVRGFEGGIPVQEDLPAIMKAIGVLNACSK